MPRLSPSSTTDAQVFIRSTLIGVTVPSSDQYAPSVSAAKERAHDVIDSEQGTGEERSQVGLLACPREDGDKCDMSGDDNPLGRARVCERGRFLVLSLASAGCLAT